MRDDDVRTWADGWGFWHASVVATDDERDDRRRARAAIRAELKARGDITGYAVRLDLAEMTERGRRHYAER